MDAETQLAALWDETQAPGHDLAFALAVEARLARRRLLIEIGAGVALALAGLVVVALFATPLLASAAVLTPSFNAAGPALAALVVLAAVVARLGWPQEEEGELQG
jgi:hypothetical protein